MSRPRAELAVEQMSRQALWGFVWRWLPEIGPASLMEYNDRKQLFCSFQDALQELHLRGDQLVISFEDQESASK